MITGRWACRRHWPAPGPDSRVPPRFVTVCARPTRPLPLPALGESRVPSGLMTVMSSPPPSAATRMSRGPSAPWRRALVRASRTTRTAPVPVSAGAPSRAAVSTSRRTSRPRPVRVVTMLARRVEAGSGAETVGLTRVSVTALPGGWSRVCNSSRISDSAATVARSIVSRLDRQIEGSGVACAPATVAAMIVNWLATMSCSARARLARSSSWARASRASSSTRSRSRRVSR